MSPCVKIHSHIPQAVFKTIMLQEKFQKNFMFIFPSIYEMQKLKSILTILILVLLGKQIENMDQVCAFIYLHVKYISSMAASFELGNGDALVSTEILGHRVKFAWALQMECKYKGKP